ncbi:MAG: phosphate ABC transporter substrate-binding protein [Alphaproteobacteria bacterium]|nr:phosphate ABC transporter substrate-binding protein [Alphaproteobacteria bacterium]
MKRTALFLLATSIGVLLTTAAHARDQIRIVGSSTVYPFVTSAAEQFGLAEKFRTPIVEATGTGGGFKLFCNGVGENTPDISNASRKITESEVKLCKKNGVTDIVEISIGYDGIVLANKRGAPLLDLSKKQIFMALARELPDGKGGWQKNPYKTWKQIDARFPDMPIAVYGPPPTSGTRDAFVELAMEPGCDAFPEFTKRFPDVKERHKNCHLLREDGGYIEAGEDDNILVQKLISNEKTLGILGYSYYEENIGNIQASAIGGVVPTPETVDAKKYDMLRGLYVYVKAQHVGVINGIAEFMRELTSENAIGEDGYLTAKGLLPLSDAEMASVHETVKTLEK